MGKLTLISIFLCALFQITSKPILAATLSLNPKVLTVKVGEQSTLSLSLDPQGESVIGTDIILTYNPQHLRVISVVNRNIFDQTPTVKIVNEVGTTKFSLVNSESKFQTSQAIIADVILETKSTITSTPLTLRFSSESTTDTNVIVEGGQNVLTQVNNASITILSPTPTPTSIPPTNNSPPSSTPTITPRSSGEVEPISSTFPATTVLEDRANPNASSAAALQIVPPGFTSPLPSSQQLTPARPRILGASTASIINHLPLLITSSLFSLFITFILYALARKKKQSPSPPPQSAVPDQNLSSPFIHMVAY